MCGIAGYKTIKKIAPEILYKMVNTLFHRGPDSDGYYFSPLYNAGMRRLSINDLTTGDQPLFNEDNSVVLFYNGEIYNYQALRNELENKGYHFNTNCDGEVICHLYEEYKENLFEKLDGMFAVAIWIEQEQKLILARDLAGEKPLYFIRLSETDLVFGSEIKSLLQFPGLDRSLDLQSLWDFPTFLWIPEPDTIYQSIKALPRGHFLVADNNGINISKYPNKFNKQNLILDEDTALEETRFVVTEAIRRRLLSDVPVGCFLSSGLDSSIITMVAAKFLPSLTTFTIGFENVMDPYHGMADESKYAEEYSKFLGLNHHTIHVTSKDFKNTLLKFCIHGDQPFSVSSGLGILAIAKAANKAGIKVLLSGDGADECFGGYSWYSYLESPYCRDKAYKNDQDISFQSFGMELDQKLDIIRNYPPHKRAWAWHYYASEKTKSKLYNPEYFISKKSSLRFFSDFKLSEKWNPKDFIKQDKEFYFPNEMLRKLDRMTMAFSVEGRAPFAAPSVLAHADRLKFSQLVQGKNLKMNLRKAFAPFLPKKIYARPKHGFNVPIDHWLKNDWKDLLEDTFAPESALMQSGLMNKNSRKTAKQMLHDPLQLHGHTIFSFIMLNLWLENSSS